MIAPLDNIIGKSTEEIFSNILLLLRGHAPKLNLLDHEGYHQTIEQCHKNGNMYGAMLITALKCYCDYLCGEVDDALDLDEVLFPLMAIDSVLSIEMECLYVWIKSGRGEVDEPKCQNMLKKIRRLSSTCPQNFMAKRCIAEGEILCQAKDWSGALEQYDQGIQAAEKYGQPQLSALALVRCAQIQKRMGLQGLIRGTIQQASRDFEKWGATHCAQRCQHQFEENDHESSGIRSNALVLSSTTSELITDADRLIQDKLNRAMLGASESKKLLEAVEDILFSYVCAKEACVFGDEGVLCWLRSKNDDELGRYTSSLRVLGDQEKDHLANLQAKLKRLGALFCEDISIGNGRVVHVLAVPMLFKDRQWGSILFINDGIYSMFNEHQIQVLNLMIPQICMGLQMFESKEELMDLNQNLENKVSERTIALNGALEKAEALSQAKSDFVAKVSHDIRTPLNSILGFSKLEGGGQALSTPSSHSSIIHQCGLHILNLLNDILDLSRLESGAMPLNDAPCHVTSFFKEMEDMFGHEAHKKGLGYSIVLEGHFPSMLVVDELKLKQLLGNLISNAIKFTLKGSVKVCCKIECSQLLIEVEDTGIGIPKHKIHSLFLPYEQGSKSVSRQFGGSGLGLSICHELSHLMSGSLAVKSILGEGSTFLLSLPHRPWDEETRAVDSRHSNVSDSIVPDLRGEQVVVVDDDPFQLQLLRSLLMETGAQVVTCASIHEAELALLSFDHVFLVVDLHLSQANGEKWLSEIMARKKGVFKHCILMTGDVSHQVSKALVDHAVLLQKPFLPEAFYRALDV